MNRELLRGEEIIFQEGNLTVTNKRIWEIYEGHNGINSLSVRSAPLGEVSEIALNYKRPIGWALFCLFAAFFVGAFSVALPDKMLLLFNLASVKTAGFWAAAALVFIGVMTFISGAVLVLEIKLKRVASGASFRLVLSGEKADREKFLAHILQLEQTILAEKGTVSAIKPLPALPNAA